MDEVIALSVQDRKTTMGALLTFSVLAVLLAAVGIYGVLAYSVAQRSREIGIRMAMGARVSDVIGMVGTEAARLAIAGILVGLVATLALARLVSSLLFGVSFADGTVYAGSVVVVATVAMLAGWAPARRAASVDPMMALREE
jgi:putative ABC transport system permease protein